jgi:hypothetical protein
MHVESSDPDFLPKGLRVITRQAQDPSEAPTVIQRSLATTQAKTLPLLVLTGEKKVARRKKAPPIDRATLRALALAIWSLVALAGALAALVDALSRA